MSFWGILSTLLPLFLIVGLLYAALRFIRKTGFSLKRGGSNQKVKINVLSSQMIMPKKYLTLVNVNGSYLLLGISDNSINMLKEFEKIEDTVKDDEAADIKFLDYFKQNLGIRHEA